MAEREIVKIAIIGAHGLIGHHAAVRLHAENCAARFRGLPEPHDIVLLGHADFDDDATLDAAVRNSELVLHFAGVNRASDADIRTGNPDIARRLIAACAAADATPHIVYANSTHAAQDSVYGNSKRIAGEIIAASGLSHTDLILPHIFGEGARPDYNNVTATFIKRIIDGEEPEINQEAEVRLLHSGEAAQIAIDAGKSGVTGKLAPAGKAISVAELFERLRWLHESYSMNLFADLSDPFTLALFNSYRSALYPGSYPRMLKLNSDQRGTLFEASRGGGGGQTFLSWTHPGITRGEHFHLDKVERFLVLQGEAMIRIRPVLGETISEFRVSGEAPAAVDMPTLHTHHIVNVGDTPLLTLFWTNAVFDPAAPDTYADPVFGA